MIECRVESSFLDEAYGQSSSTHRRFRVITAEFRDQLQRGRETFQDRRVMGTKQENTSAEKITSSNDATLRQSTMYQGTRKDCEIEGKMSSPGSAHQHRRKVINFSYGEIGDIQDIHTRDDSNNNMYESNQRYNHH